jgi:hypothetical protein
VPRFTSESYTITGEPEVVIDQVVSVSPQRGGVGHVKQGSLDRFRAQVFPVTIGCYIIGEEDARGARGISPMLGDQVLNQIVEL